MTARYVSLLSGGYPALLSQCSWTEPFSLKQSLQEKPGSHFLFGDFSFVCPDDKFVRNYESDYDEASDDRLFSFECCSVTVTGSCSAPPRVFGNKPSIPSSQLQGAITYFECSPGFGQQERGQMQCELDIATGKPEWRPVSGDLDPRNETGIAYCNGICDHGKTTIDSLTAAQNAFLVTSAQMDLVVFQQLQATMFGNMEPAVNKRAQQADTQMVGLSFAQTAPLESIKTLKAARCVLTVRLVDFLWVAGQQLYARLVRKVKKATSVENRLVHVLFIGTYADVHGMSECSQCPDGEYQSQVQPNCGR